MLTLPEMDKNDLVESLSQGEPTAMEFIKANISDAFDNTTLGIGYNTIREHNADKIETVSSSSQDQSYENMQAHFQKRKPVQIQKQETVVPRTLSQDEWKKSSYFREGLVFKSGFSEDRAKIMAEVYDDRKMREMVLEKGDTGLGRKSIGFATQMVTGIADPINLIPFGSGVIKGGSLAAKVGAGMLEGAASNIAVSAITRPYWQGRGVDSSWQDYVNDLAIGGVLGGGFSALGHGVSKIVESKRTRSNVTLQDRQILGNALDHVVESMRTGETPDLKNIEGLDQAVKNIWSIPEIERSQRVQSLQEQLVKEFNFTEDDARISIAPMVAHAQTYAPGLGMSMDEFIEKFGISEFTNKEGYYYQAANHSKLTPRQRREMGIQVLQKEITLPENVNGVKIVDSARYDLKNSSDIIDGYLVGREVINEHSGSKIKITTEGKESTLGKFKDSIAKKKVSRADANARDSIRVISNLDEVIKNAVYYETAPDYKGNPRGFDYYHSVGKLNGKDVAIQLVVNKLKGNELYDIKVQDLKLEGGGAAMTASTSASNKSPAKSPLTHSLSDFETRINSAMADNEHYQGHRGAVSFQEDGKALVSLFEKADKSTILHETGHIFLRNLESFSKLENATPEMKRDFDVMKKWLGVNDKITTEHHEKFARGFEQFLREGRSPRPELDSMFGRFKDWLTSIYKSSEDLNAKLNDDAREVYSHLLGGERNPDFELPSEIKMPEPIFKDELEIDAAIEKLETQFHESGLNGEIDKVEIESLTQALTEIKTEDDALDIIGENFTLFQSENAKKADLEKLAKQAGLSKKDMQRLAEEIKEIAGEQASLTGEDGVNEFTILKAIEEKRKKLAIEAKELKRQTYLSKIAKEKVNSHVNVLLESGATPKESVLSLIEGDSKHRGVHGAGDSVWGTYHSMSQAWLGKLHSELKELSPQIEKLFMNDAQFNENVITEMMQIREDGKGHIGVTGDELAEKAAKTLSNHAEEARKRLNLSGANIGKLDGWVPRTHDAEKLILKGEKTWMDFMRNSLDLEKTFPKIKDEAALEKALYETYQNIITGVRGERGQISGTEPLLKNPRNVAKKLGESRVLHFKDSAMELKYLKEFGQGSNILETMSSHMDISARKTALLERLGPNPDATISSSIEKMRQDIRDKKIYADMDDKKRVELIEDLGDKNKIVNREGDIGKSLMFMMGEGVSFEAPKMKFFGQTVRALNSVSKLGSATLSQFTDLLNLANEHRLVRGNNFAGAWVDTIKHYFTDITPEKQKVLDRLGVMADTINFKNYNRFDADNVNNKLGRMNDILFKISGQDYHVRHAKSGFALAMSKDLGEIMHLDFDSLPKGYKEALSQYGSIDSKKWDLIRSVMPEDVDGEKYFHPDLVDKIDNELLEDSIPREYRKEMKPQTQEPLETDFDNPADYGDALSEAQRKNESTVKNWEEYRDFHLQRAKFDLENNLRTFFIEETKNAALEPDLRIKRITSLGTKSGTLAGEAARLLMQFKSFAFTYYDRTMRGRRFAIDKDSADYGGVVHQAVAGVMLGYVAMTAKDLSKGIEPRDPTLGRTWLQAAFQSGGLGIMGDFVQAGVSSRSGADALASLAGPTISTIANTVNIGGKILREPFKENPNYQGLTSDVVDLGKSQIPFNTLWYTRAATDLLLWSQLKEALEPGSIRRTERRLKKEYNQKYLMSPSDVYGP